MPKLQHPRSSPPTSPITINSLFFSKIPILTLFLHHFLFVELNSSYDEDTQQPTCDTLSSRKGVLIVLYIIFTPILLAFDVIQQFPWKIIFQRRVYQRLYIILRMLLAVFRGFQSLLLFYAIASSIDGGRPFSCFNAWNASAALVFMLVMIIITFVLSIFEWLFMVRILEPIKDTKNTLEEFLSLIKRRLNENVQLLDHYEQEEALTDYDHYLLRQKVREMRIWLREFPNVDRPLYAEKKMEFERYVIDLDIGEIAKQRLRDYIRNRLTHSDMIGESTAKVEMETILREWIDTRTAIRHKKKSDYQQREWSLRQRLGDEDELLMEIYGEGGLQRLGNTMTAGTQQQLFAKTMHSTVSEPLFPQTPMRSPSMMRSPKQSFMSGSHLFHTAVSQNQEKIVDASDIEYELASDKDTSSSEPSEVDSMHPHVLTEPTTQVSPQVVPEQSDNRRTSVEHGRRSSRYNVEEDRPQGHKKRKKKRRRSSSKR